MEIQKMASNTNPTQSMTAKQFIETDGFPMWLDYNKVLEVVVRTGEVTKTIIGRLAYGPINVDEIHLRSHNRCLSLYSDPEKQRWQIAISETGETEASSGLTFSKESDISFRVLANDTNEFIKGQLNETKTFPTVLVELINGLR